MKQKRDDHFIAFRSMAINSMYVCKYFYIFCLEILIVFYFVFVSFYATDDATTVDDTTMFLFVNMYI